MNQKFLISTFLLLFFTNIFSQDHRHQLRIAPHYSGYYGFGGSMGYEYKVNPKLGLVATARILGNSTDFSVGSRFRLFNFKDKVSLHIGLDFGKRIQKVFTLDELRNYKNPFYLAPSIEGQIKLSNNFKFLVGSQFIKNKNFIPSMGIIHSF
jgi:hypothetical protein